MGSRFTEHFEINEPWELCRSEPASPLSSASDSFFSSSTETLSYQISSSVESSNSMYNFSSRSVSSVNKSLNEPSLIHSQSYASTLSADETHSTATSTATKTSTKSKLKRFLSTIHRSRKSSN